MGEEVVVNTHVMEVVGVIIAYLSSGGSIKIWLGRRHDTRKS